LNNKAIHQLNQIEEGIQPVIKSLKKIWKWYLTGFENMAAMQAEMIKNDPRCTYYNWMGW
jgi:hypothetical protein